LADIDFLVIGHICRDLTPAGYSLGGTVTYGAITARNLGLNAGILTRASDEIQFDHLLDNIEVHILPSDATTSFRNQYHDGRRTQYIRAVSDPIQAEDVPASWRQPKIVLLGPVAQELDANLTSAFPGAVVGAILQGWMRQWDDSGKVSTLPHLVRNIPMDSMRVVFISEEDIAGSGGMLDWLIERGPIVVLTDGEHGSTVYQHGEAYHAEPRAASEIDPTGAGDVFAAAYLVRLSETGDAIEAARFANVVASFSIEQPGPLGIPDRQAVMQWITNQDLSVPQPTE